jgi:two-component system NtrC family sensor kinase
VKPYNKDDLKQVLKKGFEYYTLKRENKLLVRNLSQALEELKEKQAIIINQASLATIGQFTAMLSHDVKNKINNAEGILYRLETRDNRQEEKKLIKEELRKIITLIDAVKDYSKPMKLDLSNADFSGFIEEQISLIQYNKKFDGIKIEKEIHPDIFANIDKYQFSRIMDNLLTNAAYAVKNSHDGKVPEIKISLKKGAEKIDLKIADNGCGIKEENLSTIFEPYFTTKEKRGTGLGLATVKKITELHEGNIEVTSKLNKGTEFIIRI